MVKLQLIFSHVQNIDERSQVDGTLGWSVGETQCRKEEGVNGFTCVK
jgi:hypothetical protein